MAGRGAPGREQEGGREDIMLLPPPPPLQLLPPLLPPLLLPPPRARARKRGLSAVVQRARAADRGGQHSYCVLEMDSALGEQGAKRVGRPGCDQAAAELAAAKHRSQQVRTDRAGRDAPAVSPCHLHLHLPVGLFILLLRGKPLVRRRRGLLDDDRHLAPGWPGCSQHPQGGPTSRTRGGNSSISAQGDQSLSTAIIFNHPEVKFWKGTDGSALPSEPTHSNTIPK